MSTYAQIIYHIVFSTKHRGTTLLAERRRDLFAYIWGILKKNQCHLYRLNGVADHIHILTSLHPTVALAELVKDIKVASSTWIKTEAVFPMFDHWQDGYGAFTHSVKDKDALIEYIKNQEEHHRTETFADEYRRFLKDAGIEFDERYLE